MKNQQDLIQAILKEICTPHGTAALDRFPSLRHVDAKVIEFGLILKGMPSDIAPLRDRFNSDDDFQVNSRRVRLEALANYCKTALRFLQGGIIQAERKPQPGPDLTKLTGAIPSLESVIQKRWLEAQISWFAGAPLASVVLMGSILEALLLSKVTLAPSEAGRSTFAPKDKSGSLLKFHEWKLTHLIDVAVDCRWLKLDRGKFSHALRESRNVVHPYQQATSGADFDEATCRTCWQVLNAAVEDLLATL